ncbi:CCE_0567 family metalloprotein [cyanobacterium endosymbiont of Epithemia clementina EcSB]|uniref:CCE_0567 family metalloprotein n=1 Tax=cyanobacterium endosymbiont of Epithemia clementina EcSB TaxID=3034674 RepID=UPI00248087BB|nr:CCE_0567 family metalloprotein [cyanobacterium endosymbiont of Epithemia clementina EcSB]WGT67055.1 CCE_0567 family metalloprotein [cyanobacterium endosymbiont of Epithemia clementina EcSB]
MGETTTTKPTPEAIEALKKSIKRLNSRAGQQKMDLHDLAEGLPTNYQTLLEMAQKTYDIYFELDQLKKRLKTWEEL